MNIYQHLFCITVLGLFWYGVIKTPEKYDTLLRMISGIAFSFSMLYFGAVFFQVLFWLGKP
jgi:hypothetical protein